MSVNLVSIGSDNGLSPIRRQAIYWTSAGILIIKPYGIYFSEILLKIQNFSLMKMHLQKYILWNAVIVFRGEMS